MEEEGRWITTKSGARVFIKNTNGYMNDFIRNKGKPKKVDYNKYKEIRSTSVDAFIAINGITEYLTEEQANELIRLGIPEELLPYGYVPKNELWIQATVKERGKDEFVKQYIEQAKETKKQDDEYQIERAKFKKYDEDRERAEKYIDNLKYNGKGSKKYKDYETDDVKYGIDSETLKTVTNDWGFKDETVQYYDKLDYDTQTAIGDYTSQSVYYNYGYYNSILNGRAEGMKLDDEAKKRMKLIDKAIEGSTIDEDMYVYRSGDVAFMNDKGEITSKGYMSTSLFNGVENFTDNPDIFKIRVPKGTKGLYIGSNTMSWIQEYEVLFGRDTTIQVLGRNEDDTIESVIKKGVDK